MGESHRKRILVVDDVAGVARAIERALERAGHSVVTESDSHAAKARLEREPFDLLITDLNMPGLDGIGLIEGVRERGGELPVIILTGAPTEDTAIRAVNLAVTAYLQKPITPEKLVEEVERSLKLSALADVRKDAQSISIPPPEEQVPPDWTDLDRHFEDAVGGLFMAYQPIVRWSRKATYGYEALARSASTALPHPGALFDAAERLGRLHPLGQKIRQQCAETFRKAVSRPSLFLNLHPHDLADDTLYETNNTLSKLALQVVLEITERARLDDLPDLEERIGVLRRQGFRIAIDDIGAGYSGLTSFVALQPDFVKLDMALVRAVHLHPTKSRVVRMLLDLCADLGINVVAEGIESVEERSALIDLGCDFFQGYLFARPGPPFPEPVFEERA